MYFKDYYHELDTHQLMEACGLPKDPAKIPEYGALCYLIAASGKKRQLIEFFDQEGVNVSGLIAKMQPFSSSEKAMIRMGLHFFNERHERDFTITDAFYSLDRENARCVLEAIKLRFRVLA